MSRASDRAGIPRARYCLHEDLFYNRHACVMAGVAALRRLGMYDAARRSLIYAARWRKP